MPYEILEEKIKSLPQSYYDELLDYVDFLIQQAQKKKQISENDSMQKLRESSLSTVWETVKNDTW